MALIDQLKAARAANDPGAVAALIPYAQFLGITMECREGELLAVMPFADHLVGNPTIPALHGGAIAALLESAAMAAALLSIESDNVLPRPVTLTFDYFRPGRASALYATASLVRRGRRICTVRAIAWQDDRDRPTATANATFLVG